MVEAKSDPTKTIRKENPPQGKNEPMKYLIFTVFIIVFLLPSGISAQSRKTDKEALVLLEKAKKEMEAGHYQQANITFRKMLKLNTVLPTEMSYLFAETLFKVGQYENSMNFLKKYQSLTDRGSDYYPLSVKLEQQLQEKLQQIKDCSYCNRFGYRLVPCDVCGGKGKTIQECHVCRGHGLISCPVCTGDGVVITTNKFGEKEYHSCSRCDAKGYIVCTVCNGKKEIEALCPVCDGTGFKATDELCDHLAPVTAEN